jgi:hypothetical protein
MLALGTHFLYFDTELAPLFFFSFVPRKEINSFVIFKFIWLKIQCQKIMSEFEGGGEFPHKMSNEHFDEKNELSRRHLSEVIELSCQTNVK